MKLWSRIYQRTVVAAIEPTTNEINKIHTTAPAVKRKRNVRISEIPKDIIDHE